MKIIHRRIQTTHSRASRCHHCHHYNVDFVVFHNVTCYANSLLSCIHVTTTYLLNITCTLVATCVKLGRLKCTNYHKGHSHYNLRSFCLLCPKTLHYVCAQFKSPSLLSHFLPTYQGNLDMKIIHQRIQITRSHASHCHHCHHYNVDFVLFQNVTCCPNSLSSCIHINTAYFFNIMCTLIVTCVILGRLECTNYHKGHSHYKH
jgi:hypothetical protein